MSAATVPTIRHIGRLDLRFNNRPWPFADQRRADIEANFAALKRERPSIWNGRILLLHSHRLDGETFHGDFLETDYASFVAWRSWGRADPSVCDCFAASALMSADGAYLLGVMGAHTANAGQIYFPCGTPDRDDITQGRVDFEGSASRELHEETGLTMDGLEAEPGWVMAAEGGLIAMIRVLHSRDPAEQLRARILAHLHRETQPELSDIRIVRDTAGLDAMMPPFVVAFLRHRWR